MKQVLVIRNDLNMRKGKMIAQGAHAAIMPFVCEGADEATLQRWVETGMKKICVRVDSEEQFHGIVAAALAAKVPVFPIKDAGHTEFHGVPTFTCLFLGPGDDAAIDAISGDLKLL